MMFGRIVSGILNENVKDVLVDKFGVDQEQANTLLKDLSFSEYLDLTTAIDNEDTGAVKAMFGLEEVNSYSAASSGGQDNMDDQLDISMLDRGDSVVTDRGHSRVQNVSQMGSKETFKTDDGQYISVTDQPDLDMGVMNKDEATQEIERIKKLAGIEDEEGLGEEIGSPTAYTCKAMSRDGSTTPNQIMKRHRKRKKPGPKTGKRT